MTGKAKRSAPPAKRPPAGKRPAASAKRPAAKRPAAKRPAAPAKRAKRKPARPAPKPAAPRFVHLGDRLLALERLRSGLATLTQTAESLGVTIPELRKWQAEHGRERVVRFAELRPGQGTHSQRLRARARRLAGLIAASERVLRALQQDLHGSVTTPSRPVARPRRKSK